ncbi:hypothetical protein ACLBR5_17575 [Escherichia coli]
MVHGVKNATNQAGDVQTVNPGQPAGTTPEADSAYALKADSGAVQQVMTARPEQSHQLQQPEADSAIQREADRVVPEHRAVCGTSGLSGCVRTGLAGVPVACRSKPE